MRGRVAAEVSGLLLMLALVSCSEASRSDSSRSSLSWRAQDVSGLPATADIGDLVVRGDIWVAVGTVQGHPVAGQPLDMAIWRSSDGLVWREAYRTRSHGDGSTTGHLTGTADGFSVVGTVCRNQACQPMALSSSDGRKWRPASRPPAGLDVRGSPRGAVSGVVNLPDASGRPGRDLVAVGYAAAEPGGGSRNARPVVWRSGDAGRTWDADTPALSGSDYGSPLDQVAAVGRIIVAHGSAEGTDHLGRDVLWRSDDGGRVWARVPVPERVDASTMPVIGRPRDALLLIGRRPSGEPALWRSEDLIRWTDTRTVPAPDGLLLDAPEGVVFAHARSYGNSDDRLELWGSSAGEGRFDRTYFFGPKEQPSLEEMVVLHDRVHVYVAVGRPGTRGFVRLSAGVACAVAHCPPAPAVPPDIVALTGYRAEPVPVLSGRQRVSVASEGAGGGWSDVTPERLLGSAKESIEDVVFPDRDHGWLVVVNVEDLGSWVLRTTDAGRTWMTTGYEGGFSMHAGTSLKVSAIGADHAWTALVVPPASGTPLVARTTDGGRTWLGGDDSVPIAGAVRFTDAFHGFSADDFGFGAHGLFETDDGGVTWRERKISLPAGVTPDQTSYGLPRFFGRRGILPVGIVEPDRAKPRRARVAFYRSDDFGATWRRASIIDVPGGSPSVQATVVSPDVWWAADGGGSVIAISTDAGRTWTQRHPAGAAGSLWIVDAADATTAVATQWDGSNAGLVTTHDAGATWQPFAYPEPQPSGHPVLCPNPGPAQIPTGVTHRTVARGDLDGGGEADRLVFYTVHPGGRDPDQWRMRAELASDAVIDVGGDEWRSRERPLGALDLDGDGHQEIFVAIDGPDSAGLGAVALTGCKLAAVVGLGSPTVYYDKKEQPGRGTAGVTCTDIDNDGDLEVVAARTGPEPGAWSYSAYRTTGGYAVLVRSGRGRAPSDPRPDGIRFGPGLQCDGLTP